ncbi:hypothetical protein C0Q70_11676 [Pomacea canaliculata]|uniref:non-specific serine/threonine protein kinase n=2 Tax=Pomacea canaliculata TaxID=400727 RepID=A0A2T7P6P7_POMCA|nr:hypothetical protein C0Q70_11676 [Pomacea canaliculata]
MSVLPEERELTMPCLLVLVQMLQSCGTSSRGKESSLKDAVPHTRVDGEAMLYENYQVGKKIGEGSFGKVYEARHKETDIFWAIKSLNKDKASSMALKQVEREVTILKKVNHPHIINLKEVVESAKRMYLVMELCTGGELADVLTEKGHFTEEETKILMTRLCSAISYLHKHG